MTDALLLIAAVICAASGAASITADDLSRGQRTFAIVLTIGLAAVFGYLTIG